MKYLFLILVLAVFISGCAQQAEIQTQGKNQTDVSIKNFQFVPGSIVVDAGATVTWINEDKAQHIIKSDSGLFESNSLENGGMYQYTFENAGEYDYHCSIHPSMQGKVIVK